MVIPTLKQLRASIPAHCFKSNVATSLVYLFVDLSCVFLSGLAIRNASQLTVISWPVYWGVQSVFFTGLWVIAHECGHGAFSKYNVLNDTIGCIIHSFLLVPYWSWKFTHSRHHQFTGHIQNDQVFVPSINEKQKWYHHSPIFRVLFVVSILLFGWPLYLLFNTSGTKFGSHFIPSSRIFKSHEYFEVWASNTILILTCLNMVCGFSLYTLLVYYGVPLVLTNAQLVAITLLQHTRHDVAFYNEDQWEFVKGALSTIDRDFGLLNYFHHHISDTHICHHLFSKIPFYKAKEATLHLRKVLGPLYRKDSRNVFEALYTDHYQCFSVKDSGDGIFYFT